MYVNYIAPYYANGKLEEPESYELVFQTKNKVQEVADHINDNNPVFDTGWDCIDPLSEIVIYDKGTNEDFAFRIDGYLSSDEVIRLSKLLDLKGLEDEEKTWFLAATEKMYSGVKEDIRDVIKDYR